MSDVITQRAECGELLKLSAKRAAAFGLENVCRCFFVELYRWASTMHGLELLPRECLGASGRRDRPILGARRVTRRQEWQRTDERFLDFKSDCVP